MASIGNENVRGLDVTVDNSLVMSNVQSIGNFDSHTEQVLKPHRPPPDSMFECLALQILHRDEAPAVMLGNFVNGADVRVVQCRGGTSLAAKTFKCLQVLCELLGKKLECDKATERGVFGLVDDTHPPAAELLEDPVVGYGLPDKEGVAMGGNLRTVRGRGQSQRSRAIAGSRTRLWLASGWGCRGRRLSRGSGSPCKRSSLGRCRLPWHKRDPVEDGQEHR